MGGFTSAPQAPAVPAPTPVVDTTVQDEAQQHLDALERRRRGRGGTIQTSERGLVTKNAKTVQKKSLLGE